MSFNYYSYIPLVLFFIFLLNYAILKKRKSYYEAIEKYWFFIPSKLSKIRLVSFLTALVLLTWATLDLRGPEERIKATIPDQKTIIIIDASASMLAEDVRPNRFQRSLFLARHFIKRAAGHQIAVVLFSDTQKRLVPFTDDIDLLDARVAALETTNLNYGNSNINQAVKESLQYFKIDNDSPETVGNILLFTDSEEHGGVFDLGEGNEVNLAVIGVGTAAGAPIPLRSNTGVFLDYKKFKGEKVTTKLNENAIKEMGKDFKNFKYWVATSYIIPTDEILTFFRGIYKKKLGETDIRIRPVYSHFIIMLGILTYFISSLFGLGKTFSKPLLTIVFLYCFYPFQTNAQEENLEVAKRTRRLKMGTASIEEKKYVAQELLKSGKAKEASILYQELNQSRPNEINSLINLGTSYASAGNLESALEAYERAKDLVSKVDEKEKIVDLIRSNTLVAINKQKQKQQQEKDKKEKEKKKQDKNNSENKDKKSESGEGEKKDQDKPQKNDKSNEKKNDPKKEEKDKSENEKKKKDENKDNSKDENSEKDEKKPSSIEEKEKQIKEKRKMVKIPAMLKQIMDQDRNLQEKYYKTNDKRPRNDGNRRDW